VNRTTIPSFVHSLAYSISRLHCLYSPVMRWLHLLVYIPSSPSFSIWSYRPLSPRDSLFLDYEATLGRHVHRKIWTCGRLHLKCDGTRRRTREKWRGNKRMEWVTSKRHMTAEHRLARAVQTLQADVHISPASIRRNWRPCWFKWTRPFRALKIL
jgi:hypothetical protein